MKIQIQITNNKEYLEKVGGLDYANAHAGKTYEAEITKDGWAIITGAKFPPYAYELK